MFGLGCSHISILGIQEWIQAAARNIILGPCFQSVSGPVKDEIQSLLVEPVEKVKIMGQVGQGGIEREPPLSWVCPQL